MNAALPLTRWRNYRKAGTRSEQALAAPGFYAPGQSGPSLGEGPDLGGRRRHRGGAGPPAYAVLTNSLTS